MAPIDLGVPIAFLEANRQALLAITASGQLYSWDIKHQKAFFPPPTLSTILSSSPNHTVLRASVTSNGQPLIHVSNNVVYSYDPNILAFIKVTERWWAENSDAWNGRARATTQGMSRGIMTLTEAALNSTDTSMSLGGNVEVPKPQWWSIAITLGHLETRMHAIKLLNSSAEYRQVVLLYAKRIADEGFRAKAEELIKELFGPVFW